MLGREDSPILGSGEGDDFGQPFAGLSTMSSLPYWLRGKKPIIYVLAITVVVLVIIVSLAVAVAIIIPLAVIEDDSGGSGELRDCKTAAAMILELAMDPTKNLAWETLAEMADTFGPRFSGTPNLENAIDWVLQKLNDQGFENVVKENVTVPHWIRGGTEELIMTTKYWSKRMLISTLGGSIGTPPDGITANVLVVRNWTELNERSAEAAGRIVVFNAAYTTYGETVQYRSNGAKEASKYGAVAALVRSIAQYSLYTPHTGNMHYDTSVAPEIPTAAITVEDAMMMQRMQDRNQNITLKLTLTANNSAPDKTSHNVIGEITGSKFPNQVVVIGGHIDSWDIGEGALDDGTGVVVTWEALKVIKELGLQPKRTIRFVGWTNEENGAMGAKAYRDRHMDEGKVLLRSAKRANTPDGCAKYLPFHATTKDTILALESDAGTNSPTGLGFTGSNGARAVMKKIGQFLKPIALTNVGASGGGVDIAPLIEDGAAGASLDTNRDMDRYFWVHHTNADTMDKVSNEDLMRGTVLIATYAYCVADLGDSLKTL